MKTVVGLNVVGTTVGVLDLPVVDLRGEVVLNTVLEAVVGNGPMVVVWHGYMFLVIVPLAPHIAVMQLPSPSVVL